MWSNFINTSREHIPSNTSKIASIPCEDTNCQWNDISGFSVMIVICTTFDQQEHTACIDPVLTSWSQVSRRWKSGADGVSLSIKWFTMLHRRACLSCCNLKLVLRSSSAKPSSIWTSSEITMTKIIYLSEWINFVVLIPSCCAVNNVGKWSMYQHTQDGLVGISCIELQGLHRLLEG